jgi:hypothetical protein
MASGSWDEENFLELGRDVLSVIDAVGGNSQSQRPDGRNCRLASRSVGHHSGHGFDIGPPTTIIFLSQYDWNGFGQGCAS